MIRSECLLEPNREGYKIAKRVARLHHLECPVLKECSLKGKEQRTGLLESDRCLARVFFLEGGFSFGSIAALPQAICDFSDTERAMFQGELWVSLVWISAYASSQTTRIKSISLNSSNPSLPLLCSRKLPVHGCGKTTHKVKSRLTALQLENDMKSHSQVPSCHLRSRLGTTPCHP